MLILTQKQRTIQAARLALDAKRGDITPARLKGEAWHLFKFKTTKELERVVKCG